MSFEQIVIYLQKDASDKFIGKVKGKGPNTFFLSTLHEWWLRM